MHGGREARTEGRRRYAGWDASGRHDVVAQANTRLRVRSGGLSGVITATIVSVENELERAVGSASRRRIDISSHLCPLSIRFRVGIFAPHLPTEILAANGASTTRKWFSPPTAHTQGKPLARAIQRLEPTISRDRDCLAEQSYACKVFARSSDFYETC